ncbi:hypothetical protein P43SY_003113 [Pythium insidiosum]|uniref:Ubiquitin carboxyl-terminal hydrolase n=1 Tax=Pythium insidiosum TaxID=114742 RepID=A0AAD5QA70_PYTIN|nr:hypothetical protein P43SY_003113 [Pythium insidiosum]
MNGDSELHVKCVGPVYVEDNAGGDGAAAARTELPQEVWLKKEFGNARLVSGDAILWVANSTLTTQPMPASSSDADSSALREVRVTGAKRKFVFTLDAGDESDSFLAELRAQVEGKAVQDLRSKKRKIRKKLADTHSSGFVPVVNSLRSPVKAAPLTPTKRRLSDSAASPRLAPPLPFSVSSVSSPAPAAASPLQSPFRSPFRKRPPPRTASPMVPLPPKSPASASASASASPRPREFLSPVRPRAERTPSTTRSADGKRPPLTPPVGIANKRVRSLQRMLDDSSTSDSPALRSLTPPVVRSPFFPRPDRNANDAADKENATAVEPPSPPLAMRSPLRPRTDSNVRLPPLVPSPSLGPSASPLPPPPRKATHGLLNLGNYCYMNAIIQSLAAIPEFVAHLEREEWLVKVIRRHCEQHGTSCTLEQARSAFEDWRQRDPVGRLAVSGKLAHLLQQVVNGSETTINPEPLKVTMGRKNAMFATHMQQDAHEFLLQLVNEYEKELVAAVRGVVAELEKGAESSTATADQPSPEPAPPRRVSLLNFFRPESKALPPAAPAAVQDSSPSRKDTEQLVSQLFPAQCFRAELTRTLTCRACGYHRNQVETFSDFSLDMPFVPPPPAPAPTPEPKRCHCGEDAKLVQEPSGYRFYCCPRSACSLRDAVTTEDAAEAADSALSDATTVDTDSEPPIGAMRPSQPTFQSVRLQELLKKQFESEVLELTCEKCSNGREAVSEYQVKSLPRVLVLHLKRFEVNPHTGTLYKRCDAVEAPVTLAPCVDINGPAAASESGPVFRLQSVVHHLGRSIDEGHYVADIRDRRGDWRRRNDATETVISEDLALRATRSQESCYMLFYVREIQDDAARDKENAPAPSSPEAQGPSTALTVTSDSVAARQL